jgi:hypothetical protein
LLHPLKNRATKSPVFSTLRKAGKILEATTEQQKMARAKKTSASVPAVPTESEIGPDDPHYNIPRDANGRPEYFILPDGVRRSYERRMRAAEAGWRETGDPVFVAEAHTWATYHRQPPPMWMHEAFWVVALGRRSKRHAARAKAAAIRLMRYQAVRDAQRSGLTWDAAYVRATEVLKDSGARGEPDTMRTDYSAAKADLKNGRHGLYSTPHLPQGKLGDALKRAASSRGRNQR